MAKAKPKVESRKSKVADQTTGTKEKQLKHAEVVAETTPVETAPEAKIEIEAEEAPESTAKAGKRSAKAIKEEQEHQAKEERKQSGEAKAAAKSKPAKKPTRPKVERAGKKYREAAKLIDKSRAYPLSEALDLATKTSTTKFDATVELHVNLGVDPKQADQNVRDTVVLPAGTGKEVRVAAISDDASAEKLFAKLDKEQIDFDVLVATPAMMPRLGKYARLLGPRGLMPNPKSGTVATDVAKAVAEAKAGRVEYRVDQAGIVHLGIGKVSFGAARLEENAAAVLASLRAAKPASLKSVYIKSMYLTTSMGPSIKLEN